MVKKIIFFNVLLWFVLVIVVQGLILDNNFIFQYLGFAPKTMFEDFLFWQPVTYMFLHSKSLFHILFNMFMLWMLGSELEKKWGPSFFLKYYLLCGIGSAFIYSGVFFVAQFFSKSLFVFSIPVVGASAAIFGLLAAYGLLFKNRIIFFMMIFPIKAKNLVLLLAGIEVFNLLDHGLGGPTANLSHLGGLLVGFLYLQFIYLKPKKVAKFGNRHLKLVIDNSEESETWH
ncbi:MAG: rhomboid family intramembrane serine protease [Bdellovibrionaceae bacterium]|nr:rhomboid family intramembrane serine protease [Pseudobdellovibrionaceae bacterium]